MKNKKHTKAFFGLLPELDERIGDTQKFLHHGERGVSAEKGPETF